MSFPVKQQPLAIAKLLRWYHSNQRNFTWRETKDPYQIAIDTNVRRVLIRMLGCPESLLEIRAKAIFQKNKKNAAHLNHALMDLGATFCKSTRVECGNCPLKENCHFFQSGKYRQLTQNKQEKGKKNFSFGNVTKKKITMDVAIACIHRGGEYLIAKRKIAKGGFWEFPGGKKEKGENIRNCLKRETMEELGIEISVRPSFFSEEWEEKELLWRLHFCRCQILSGTPTKREHTQLKWVPVKELSQYNFPKTNRRAIERLERMERQ